MIIRDLLVTDIRCRYPGCNAGPGEGCASPSTHLVRRLDYEKFVDEGWRWQEVITKDKGIKS